MAKTQKMYVVMRWADDIFQWEGSYQTLDEAKEVAQIGDEIYKVSTKWEIKQNVRLVKGKISDEFE